MSFLHDLLTALSTGDWGQNKPFRFKCEFILLKRIIGG